MRDANRHVAEIVILLCEAVEPGLATSSLDHICRREIRRRRLQSPYLRYFKYPASVCTSIDLLFVSETAKPIPTASGWGLIIMMLLLLTAGRKRLAKNSAMPSRPVFQRLAS